MSFARSASRCVAALFALSLFAGRAAAQSVSEMVPENAIAYLGWNGHKNFASQDTHFNALLAESKLGLAVKAGLVAVRKSQAGDREALHVVDMVETLLPDLWSNGGAVYLTAVTERGPAGRIIVRYSGDPKTLLAKLPPQAINNMPPAVKLFSGDGVIAVDFDLTEGAGQANPATDLAIAKPLSKSEKFSKFVGSSGVKPMAELYVDLAALLITIREEGGDEDPEFMQMMEVGGLKDLGTLHYVAGFNDKNWRSATTIGFKGPPTGVLELIFGGHTTTEQEAAKLFDAIPDTAQSVMTFTLDFDHLVAKSEAIVASLDPTAAQQMDAGLNAFTQAFALDVRKELFPVLGKRWALYSATDVGGGSLWGSVLVNKLTDDAAGEVAVDKLGKAINGVLLNFSKREGPMFTFKPGEIDGVKFRYCSLPVLAPSIAVKNGYMLVALQPQTVVAAAKRIGSASVKSRKGYADAVKQLNAPANAAVSYMDLPAYAAGGYQGFLMLAQAGVGLADMYGGGAPVGVMPPFSKVAPHVTPSVSATWVDENGFHSVSESPFPGAELLSLNNEQLPLVAMSMSVIMPSFNKAREQANRVKSASNMRQIGLAMMIYADENRGKFPPDLGTLITTQEIGMEVFVNPSGNTQMPQLSGGPADTQTIVNWVNGESDYVYLAAGLSNVIGPDVVVLHDKDGAHGGEGRNLLFGDGHVEFHRKDSAIREIQKSTVELNALREKKKP